MADQAGKSPTAQVGQQGQGAAKKVAQDSKSNKPSNSKQAKGGKQQIAGRHSQPNSRPPKAAGASRTAEIGSKGFGFVKLVKEKENFGFIRWPPQRQWVPGAGTHLIYYASWSLSACCTSSAQKNAPFKVRVCLCCSSPELDEQLFFHGSEVVPPEGYNGSTPSAKDILSAGDEVEFLVGQSTGSHSNYVAQQVKKLPLHTIKAQLLSEERYCGTVTRELNSGQWRSETSSLGEITFTEKKPDGKTRAETSLEFTASDAHRLRGKLPKGSAVEFSICTDNQTQSRRAVHIELRAQPRSGGSDSSGGGPANQSAQVTTLHGFVKVMKPQSGIIRCVERDERFVFKKSDASLQQQDKLLQGAEVKFGVLANRRGADTVVNVVVLGPGTLTPEQTTGPVLGRVVQPISLQEGGRTTDGLVVSSSQNSESTSFRFPAGPLEASEEDASSLQVDDEVQFTLVTDFKSDRRYIRDLRLLCRACAKRELGKVRTLKGAFGFLRCCQRSGDLFFHYSQLVDCTRDDLEKDDDVEFTVERSKEHGTIAVRVRKMPLGTAVFETVSPEEFRGIISSTIVKWPSLSSGQLAPGNGVLTFMEDGQPMKLLYGERDFKEEVSPGDHVTFHIADNVNAAKQAAKLGAKVSRLVGRRATQGKLLVLTGVVRQAKSTYGSIRYSSPSGSESSVFFHSSEVLDSLALKAGDKVTFGLWDNPKTKEQNAKRIVRIKEAPSAPSEETSSPSNSVGNQNVVRMAAMPDGTRGFRMGRAAALRTVLPDIPPAKGVLVDAPKAPGAPVSNGRTPEGIAKPKGKSSPSLRRLSTDQTKAITADESSGATILSLPRSNSGHALNPAAPTFMPKTLSVSQLGVAPLKDMAKQQF